MMSKGNKILLAVLSLQLAGLVIQHWPRKAEAGFHKGPLLSDFVADDVERIEIHGASDTPDATATLLRDNQTWRVESATGRRADHEKVQNMLRDLQLMPSLRVVSSTDKHHVDMNVAANAFERKLVLTKKGGDTQIIFFGHVGKSGAPYVRMDGSPLVHETRDVSSYGWSPSAADWLDKSLLNFEESTIVKIAIENEHGQIVLEAEEGKWRSVGTPEAAEIDGDKVRRFLTTVRNLKVDNFVEAVVEEKKTKGVVDNAPVAEIKLTTQGKGGSGEMELMIRPGKTPEEFMATSSVATGTIPKWRVDDLLAADVASFKKKTLNKADAGEPADAP